MAPKSCPHLRVALCWQREKSHFCHLSFLFWVPSEEAESGVFWRLWHEATLVRSWCFPTSHFCETRLCIIIECSNNVHSIVIFGRGWRALNVLLQESLPISHLSSQRYRLGNRTPITEVPGSSVFFRYFLWNTSCLGEKMAIIHYKAK